MVLIFGLLAGILSGAAVAWACTEQAAISFAPGSGPPGSPVTVQGTAFRPGPVEIRWHTLEGAVLGTANGPQPVARVTIPANASPQVYYIVAVQRGANGAISAKASDAFQVTAPASVQTASPQQVPPKSPGPASANTAPWSGGPSRTALGAPPSPATVPGPSAALNGASAPLLLGGGPVGSSAGPSVPSASPAAGQGSLAQPLASTVSGDLWSGFASGGGVSQGRAPSLSEAPAGASHGTSSSAMAAGAVLVALGMAGLGGAVLSRRRRHALAR
jgi:hypothetical protein